MSRAFALAALAATTTFGCTYDSHQLPQRILTGTLSVHRLAAVADDSDAITVIVRAHDQVGEPYAGVAVSLAVDGGARLDPQGGQTDNDGHFSAELRSDSPGDKVVSAELRTESGVVIPIAQTRRVTFEGSLSSTFTLADGIRWMTCPNPEDMALGDVDNDGDVDAVITCAGGFVQVLFNDGSAHTEDGTWAPLGESLRSVVLHDLDRDGDLDLLVSDVSPTHNKIWSLAGDGIGGFGTVDAYHPPGSHFAEIVLGDLDQNGVPELLAGSADQDFISIFWNIDLVEDGPPEVHDTGVSPRGIAVGDIDGNGWPDVVVANTAAETVARFHQRSDGGGLIRRDDTDVNHPPVAVAIGDLDGDGAGEIAIASTLAGDTELYSDIGPDSLDRFDTPESNSCNSVMFGDINLDGKLDLIVGNSGDRDVTVNLGDGDNDFDMRITREVGGAITAVGVADMDGNGYPDVIALSRTEGHLMVVPTGPPGTF